MVGIIESTANLESITKAVEIISAIVYNVREIRLPIYLLTKIRFVISLPGYTGNTTIEKLDSLINDGISLGVII